jgi:hypothetical protein
VIPSRQRVLFVRPDCEDDQSMGTLNGRTEIIQQAQSFGVADLRLAVEGLDRPFDYIVLSNALDHCPNIGSFLHRLRRLCEPHTRIIVSSRRSVLAALWRLIRAPGSDRTEQAQNLLSEPQMEAIMGSCGFQQIESRRSFAIYCPIAPAHRMRDDSLTICLTCRNEKGNIEPIVRAIPAVSERQEILFVEGHSDDGTRAEIERLMASYPEKNIRLISQPGIGQGDAIREGFSRATGAFIVLLEANMTSPPEDIAPVYESLRAGFSEFIGGTRFVYPMPHASMPLTNRLGNWIFACYFSWLFKRRVSDVLCGIKGISKVDFDKIAARWGQWGIDDPFGDFELLFGAAQIGLKIGELPVHYRPRPYGQTKTRAFQHGAILFQLAARAFLTFRR